MNKNFQYFSEIMLLTKSDHPEELYCWLTWHLNILHFDHIVLFDNESNFDVLSVISQFPKEKIEYHLVKGWPDQYKLYNEYLKSPKSLWTIALDDDEYFYISDKYNYNIQNFIESIYKQYQKNKYYILWTHLLSPDPIDDYYDLYINTHTAYSFDACRLIRSIWNEDNGWGKCLINNSYSYSYSMSWKSRGHIPTCLDGDNTTILVRNGREIEYEHIKTNGFNLYEDCFIAHYQYKNKKDWKIKCTRPLATHPTYSIKNKIKVYSIIYQNKSLFKPCTLLKDKYNDYIATK